MEAERSIRGRSAGKNTRSFVSICGIFGEQIVICQRDVVAATGCLSREGVDDSLPVMVGRQALQHVL